MISSCFLLTDPNLRCKTDDNCCQYSTSTHTGPLLPPKTSPIQANISQPIHCPVQESFISLLQNRLEVETTLGITNFQLPWDVEIRTADASQNASQLADNGSHDKLVRCEGDIENVGQGQQSANQKAADNNGSRKEGSRKKETERSVTQLEEYIFQLQVKLTEKVDRVEKLEKDRRQVISGLTRFRNSMAELQEVRKENADLRKHVEKMEQKYQGLHEEMTAVKTHNHHLVLELNKLKQILNRGDTMSTPLTNGDWLSSGDYVSSIRSPLNAMSPKKFLARGASSPELTELKVKAETADAKGHYDLYSATLPVFRSIDQSCLVNIMAKLTQQLKERMLSWNQHLLLDIPGHPWQHDVDYMIIDGLPVSDDEDPERELPSRFSLRICHREKNYVLTVSHSEYID